MQRGGAVATQTAMIVERRVSVKRVSDEAFAEDCLNYADRVCHCLINSQL